MAEFILAIVLFPVLISLIIEFYKHLFKEEEKQKKIWRQKQNEGYPLDNNDRIEEEDRTIEKIFNGRGW